MADKKISELTELTTPDGTEELVVNDSGTSKKITQSNLFKLADNVKAQFGASNDLQIYHDGSHSYINESGTGNLNIRAVNLTLRSLSDENYVFCQTNGYVKLYHNNAEKLATTSTGIDVTGRITTDGITEDTSGNVGIGTSSPDAKLDIDTPTVPATDTYSGLQLKSGSYGYIIEGGIKQGAGGTLVFKQNQNGTITERMRIDSSGNVMVGRTATGWLAGGGFRADGSTESVVASGIAGRFGRGTTTGTLLEFRYNNSIVGSIQTSGSSTSYNTTSDYRLKENVEPMTGSIDRLKELKPSRFNFIADADTTVDGFLAHEAQTVVPEAVTGTKDAMRTEEYEVEPAVEATYDDDGNELTPAVEAVMGEREVPDYQGIDQAKLVPLLTSALQEAVAKIEALEARVEALENA